MSEKRSDDNKPVALKLADDMVEHASRLAKRMHVSLDTILARWIRQGTADTSVRELLRKVTSEVEEYSLGAEDQLALADLIARHPDLAPDDQLRMDELLIRHRQSLVRQAQAISDWLRLSGGSTTAIDVRQITRLDSSMLYAVGYNLETRTLEVVFNNGGIYRYYHVPAAVYQALLASEFPGRFLWTTIVNIYPYERMGLNRS